MLSGKTDFFSSTSFQRFSYIPSFDSGTIIRFEFQKKMKTLLGSGIVLAFVLQLSAVAAIESEDLSAESNREKKGE